jgi:hypothetical protein
LLKYVRLYAKAEVEFHESVRYADWLSYRVPVKPKAERQAQGCRSRRPRSLTVEDVGHGQLSLRRLPAG